MKVAVVILNYNGLKFLRQFLQRIVDNCTENGQVIIADNASTDGSLEWLRENYKSLRLIQFSSNKGFAEGYNEALRQIDAKYFVILNSDIEVTDGWLAPLINYMDSNIDVAACQPKILSYANKDSFEYAGAAGGFIDAFGFPFCRGRIFTTLEKDNGQYDDVKDVFWVTGACMIIRTEIFFEAGGFESFFFAHMEEIDLCWRIHMMKHRIVSLPYSKVYHIGGGTLDKNSSLKAFLNYRNNLSMLAKNLPVYLLVPVFLFRIVSDAIAAIVFLFYSGINHFAAVPKAYFSFIYHLPQIARERKTFRRKYSNGLPASVYRKPVLIDYFVFRKTKFFSLQKRFS